MLATHLLGNKTPYEVLHKVLLDYSHIKCFGYCDKLNPRGLPCVFLGYPKTQKGYKLLDLKTNKLFVSRNVKSYETTYPYRLFHKTTQVDNQTSHDPNFKIPDVCCDDDYHDEKESEPIHTDDLIPDTMQTETQNLDSQPDPAPPVRKSERTHKSLTWMIDYHLSNLAYPTKLQTTTNIFREAVSKDEWVKVMNDELEALELNNTWEITDLPHGKTLIGCKWLHRIK